MLSTVSFDDESKFLHQLQEKNNKVLEVFFFNINKEIGSLSVSSKNIENLSQNSLLQLSKIKEKLDKKTREAKENIDKIHLDIDNKLIDSNIIMRKNSASFNRFQYSNILKLEKQINMKIKDILIVVVSTFFIMTAILTTFYFSTS